MRIRSSTGKQPPAPPQTASGSSKRIGTILADEGFIEPADIDAILSQQSDSGEFYGQTAVKMGKVTPSELDYALAKQVDATTLPSGDPSLDPLLICAFDLEAPYSAQIRTIRSKILALQSDAGVLDHRFCAVIGMDCHRETAVLSSNLAIVIARMGGASVLVDADYKAPSIHELFRLQNRIGLSTMRGDAVANDVAQQTAIANLQLIAAGAAHASSVNAPERETITTRVGSWQYAETQFVISMNIHDSAIIAPAAQSIAGVNSALLLTRKHQTPIKDVRRLIDELDERGIAISGIVIV